MRERVVSRSVTDDLSFAIRSRGVCCMIVEPLESRRLLHAGEVDLSFGTNAGSTDVTFAAEVGSISTSLVLPDGGILNVGRTVLGNVSLSKLTADGKLDTSWGVDGQILTSYQWDVGATTEGKVAVDAARGRIALIAPVDRQTKFDATPDLVMLKLADGTVDTSFSGDGVIFSDESFNITHVAFQSDGRVVVAGSARVADSTSWEGFVRRYGTSGTQDMTFGPSGGQIEISSDFADDLEVLSDNRIVVPSHYYHVLDIDLGGDIFFGNTIELLSADGDRVWSKVVASGSDNEENAMQSQGRDIETAADGSILLLYEHGSLTKLARYALADGTRDDAFAPDVGHAGEIAVDDDGHILVLDHILLLRLDADGTLDRTYASNGVAVMPTDDAQESGALAVQNGDQAIVAVPVNGTLAPDYRVVRLQGGAGAPANAVINRRGSLIVDSRDIAEEVSLYIRGRDGRLIVRVGDFAKSFAPSRVKRIAIFTYGGDDTITIHDGVKGAYVDAGEGEDTINGGRGDDALLGGGGKDKVYGFDGNDTLLGGASNDYLLGGAGKDDLFGQGGIDTLSGAGGNDRLFGGAAADFCNGGNGADAAAQSDEDTYDSVETMLTLT
jgi:uncharacterized delta-60 repeat protein